MPRGLGINAVLAAAFESTYGTAPGSGFFKMPFSAEDLGSQRGLIASDLLGYGREPRDPVYDVVRNTGTITVPVDQRAIGLWLKLLMGPPVTVAGASATGSIQFSAQPAAASTITINGTVFTFVASGATGNQINIGANLAATITAAATVLNASVVPGVAAATYTASSPFLYIAHDTTGHTGNTFALAASASSNGVVSASTLLGGTNTHTFTSGSTAIPSMSIEVGNPDVPTFAMHYGVRADSIKIGLSPSGLLSAAIAYIAKGEAASTDTTSAGTPTSLSISRLPQATGSIKRGGVEIGGVVQGDITYSNQLDPVETINSTSEILDSNPGIVMSSGSFTAVFQDRALFDQARSQLPVALSYGWAGSNGSALIFNFPRVFLPVPKRPIEGPRGIQAQYDWQASGETAASCTVALTNDLAGSVYA